MSRLLLRDLSPGTTYNIQLRSQNLEDKSDWSAILPFTTQIDDREPNAPTSVTWTSAGRSFIGTWVAPTTLLDGSPFNNFDHFEVRITYSGSHVYYNTQSLRLDFTYEMNEAMFGTARSPLSLAVRAVSVTGTVSQWAFPTPNPAANPIPGGVTGITVIETVEQIQLKWTAPADLDLVGFNVYGSQVNGFTPGPSNLLYSGNTTSFTHSTSSLAPWYFHIRAVDIFSQEGNSTQTTGTAHAAAGADTTPPDAPTSVTTAVGFDDVRQQAYIDVSWTASVSTDVRSYVIRYAGNTAANWEYTTVDGSLTTARVYVLSGTNYYVGVSARDFSGNNSSYANSATYPHMTPLDTTAPSQPSAPTAVGNTMQVQVTHANTKQAGGSIEPDTVYYDVYASKTSGFTESASNHIGKLIVSAVTSDTFPLPSTILTGASEPWYIKVKAVDRSGNVSVVSNETTVTPGLIAGANIADATITSAKITTLVADKITAGTGLIVGLTIGNATQAGYISSYDYVAGTTGYKIGGTSGGVNILEINDGLVKARAVELRNSFNLMPPTLADFEARRATYDSAIIPAGVSISISSDAFANGGTQALNLEVNNEDWTADIGNGPIIEVEDGTEYIFSFYAKAETAATMYATMMHEVVIPATAEDPETVTLQGVGTPTSIALTTSYARYSFVFVGPNGPVLPRFFGDVTSVVGNNIKIDALQVEERVGALDVPSRWMPPSSTFLDGGQIRTGSIQSSDESTGRPAWLIDMAGGAEFANAKILGSLVVGTADESDLSYIQSGNYDTATLGWKIDATGKAEFNDTTIRGEGTLTNATITSDLTVSAEAGSSPATIGLVNGSIQTIYGTLTSPPAPTVSHYDNVSYTMAGQVANAANTENMDYYGPVYIGTDTWFVVAEQFIDDFWIYMTKADSTGGTHVSYKSVGLSGSATAYGLQAKTVLSGLSYDGSTFYVGVNYPDAGGTGNDYAYLRFTNTGTYTDLTPLAMPDADRDNGYRANWQKSGASWYVAYCLSTDVEENRVLNPDFASSISNWDYYAGSGTTTFTYDSGNERLQVKNYATGANNYAKGAEPFLESPIAAVGDNIYVSTYVRKSGTDSNIRIKIEWANGSSNTSPATLTPTSGRILFNAQAPVAGAYTVSVYVIPVSGNWPAGGTAVTIDNMQVSNNKANLRKVPLGFRDGDTTGWQWQGTANASRSFRTFLDGEMLVDKYNATTNALEQRNVGHQLYSDITGFVVGEGDYNYANVTNPDTFAVTRRPDPTQPSNNYGLTFMAYVDPGTGIGTDLVFREGAYTFVDGLGYNSTVGDYRCYNRTTYKVEILPHIHGDGIGPLSASVTYWHDNVLYGGTQRRTLPGPIAQLSTVFSRRRIALTNLIEPEVPGTVASTDAPTGFWFYWGTQGTTDYTKFYGTGVLGFDVYSPGTKVVFSDMRMVPRTTPTTLVPANNGASAGPPSTTNEFAGVAGFVSSKIKSANDIFSVDGNGVGRIGALAFSELGLELDNTFGGTSGEFASATGGFIVRHDGTGAFPLNVDTKIYTGSCTNVGGSPFVGTNVTLCRIGNLVWANGYVSRASSFSTSFVDAAQIPTGFRPAANVDLPGGQQYSLSSGVYYQLAVLSSTGRIQCRQSAANTNGAIINAVWRTTDAYP